MLRINQTTNAAAAKSYYTSPAEYYRGGDQELVGQWGGKAAEWLDLAGDILQPQFERLCDNRHPVTGGQLTARMRKDRRVGYDFNFHACKSASLLYGLNQDAGILAAFRSAVRATMAEMEAGVKVRIRKCGAYSERTVGNLVYGEFIHFTARPVGGKIDPHLHAHAFVPNLCWDGVEHAWKAIDVASIKEGAPHWQRRFQKHFGEKLAKLGYPLVWKDGFFEIAGISRDLIERFSLRTGLINRLAFERGITDPRDKDQLGAMTREKKRNASLSEVRASWRQRLTDADRIALARHYRRPGYREPSPRTGQEAVTRLRAEASSARPELTAWEQERRDFIQQQPWKRVHPPGKAR